MFYRYNVSAGKWCHQFYITDTKRAELCLPYHEGRQCRKRHGNIFEEVTGYNILKPDIYFWIRNNFGPEKSGYLYNRVYYPYEFQNGEVPKIHTELPDFPINEFERDFFARPTWRFYGSYYGSEGGPKEFACAYFAFSDEEHAAAFKLMAAE